MAKIKKKTKDKGKKSFVVWMTVIGALLVASYAGVLGWRSKPKSPHPPFSKGGILTEVVDPVCEMKVKPPAEGHIEYRAKHYYFCSATCKDEFEKDPGKYIHRRDAEGAEKKYKEM